ncbi:MAG: PAS domain S-box protein [Mucilaginibacter sp.]|uniref:PAS domain S-box protein n=1 Tax=Mucilaginibacter sp. TaxID=1882438 RepID=UPI0031B0F4A4
MMNTQSAYDLAMLAAIVNSSDDAIISKTLDGHITTWNAAAERILGYTEAEAIGQHISMIIPKEHLPEEERIIAHIAAGKRVDPFETLRQTKDGRLIPLSITVSPIIDARGKIVGASKIARDITERKQAEEHQARLAAIINTSDDAIIGKTLQGIITSWNNGAERIFGYSESEALGKHISLLIPQERLNEEDHIIGNIAAGKRVDHFETVRLAKDGRLIDISLSVSPITDHAGKIIGASKIARDISEQKAAAEEIKQLYEQVKLLNDRKDEFIAVASHEMRTPLTTMQATLQLLRRIAGDKEIRFIDSSLKQVQKLSSLINDLLDVTKIEAGKLPLNREIFDLKKLVAEAIELAGQSNPDYTFSLNGDIIELPFYGDPHRLEQVLTNLLSNAVKYSPDDNRIEVTLSQTDETVMLTIHDHGMGIPPDKLPLIFTRFYRAHGQLSKIAGLGIGLYICAEIISRHGGRIWAESEPGLGSTFFCTLPKREANTLQQPAA